MRWNPRTCLVGVIASLLATTAAVGQNDGSDMTQDRLDLMEAELSRLREDNAVMQREIGELRTINGDQWLTERRADEIRSLVADTLADADTRASLRGNGMTAGWNEHFFLASADGRFKLQISGQMQFRWLYNYHDAADRHRHGFEMTRTRLTFQGHVFNPNLTFLIRTDPTRNEPGLVTGLYFTRDAWIRYQFDNDVSIRAGRFKLPFNREELVSSAYQMAVERSLVSENMNLGRSDGIELTYATPFHKLMFAFSDGAADSLGGFGVAGTDGSVINANALIEDVEWAITGRWEWLLAGNWKQFNDFTSPLGEEYGALLGVGAHWQQTESNGTPTPTRDETRWYALTADLSMEWGGANAFASFTYDFVDDPGFHARVYGIVTQAGVYFTPKLEVFARWEYGWWDVQGVDADFHDLNVLTMGAIYYLDGHDLKWSTDIGFGLGPIDGAWITGADDAGFTISGWRVDPDESNPQIVFRTQFQLLF